jgi:hypothetical protein
MVRDIPRSHRRTTAEWFHHWLPVSFQHQQIRNLVLHRMFPVLRGIDQSQTEEEQNDRQHETEAEADPPYAHRHTLVVACKDDECDHASHDEAKVDGEIGADSHENASLAPHVGRFVGCFSATRGAGGILSYTVSARENSCSSKYDLPPAPKPATPLPTIIIQKRPS